MSRTHKSSKEIGCDYWPSRGYDAKHLVHKKQRQEAKRPPVCGEYFCDACGDCICCYGEDKCYGTADGKHMPLAPEVGDGG